MPPQNSHLSRRDDGLDTVETLGIGVGNSGDRISPDSKIFTASTIIVLVFGTRMERIGRVFGLMKGFIRSIRLVIGVSFKSPWFVAF
jgi:hypothetical protein